MLADGTSVKCLTGVDDHSRFCVSAALMVRDRTQAVCDALEAALAIHGGIDIAVDGGLLVRGGSAFVTSLLLPAVGARPVIEIEENPRHHLALVPRAVVPCRYHRHPAEQLQRALINDPASASSGTSTRATTSPSAPPRNRGPHAGAPSLTPALGFPSAVIRLWRVLPTLRECGQVRHVALLVQ